MKRTLLLLLLLLGGSAGPTWAQAPQPDLSFDLFQSEAKAPAPSAEDLQRSLAIGRQATIRRGVLTAHQTVGFITLASLAATLVIGQLNYQDLYVNGDFSARYRKPHLGLGIGTTVLFGATGILALAAPNPYPKPYKLDSAMVHRVAMALATAGMVTQVILGPVAHARVGYDNQAGLGLAHLIVGYATFGFMATGVVAYFL